MTEHAARRWARAAVAVLLVVLLAPPAGAQATTWRIAMDDGVELVATLHLPAQRPAPAVILGHGFGGDRADVAGRAAALTDAGYVVLAPTFRGFGDSGGEITLDAGVEGADVEVLVSWLAGRDEVSSDAPGDPRVGVAGASYGGGIALLGAARDARIDAVVAVTAWSSLATALAPEAAQRADGPTTGPVWKRRWAGLLFAAGAQRPAPCGRFTDELCDRYAEVAVTGEVTPAVLDRLRAADVDAAAITAPVLLVSAQSDTLFDVEQSIANAAGLRGPWSLTWIPGDHGAPSGPQSDRVDELTRRWLDRHLRGEPTPVPVAGFRWSDELGDRVRSASRTAAVSLSASRSAGPGERPEAVRRLTTVGPGVIANPPGGTPAAVTTLPGVGVGAVAALLEGVDVPGQTVLAESEALDAELDVLGAPVVDLEVASDSGSARVFVRLEDVAPDGRPTILGGRVAPLALDGLPGRVEVALPVVGARVPAGHRLRVVVSATDDAFANRTEGDRYQIDVGDLRVPLVGAAGADAVADAGRRWPAAWSALVGLTAVALVTWLGLRRRRHHADVAPTPDTPTGREVDARGVADVIELHGLAKTFGDGHVAVDGVDLRVGRGQIVGLLGPNGAGKTTTLRMLLGLVHPTAGHAVVLGARITPGHPVLGRVGVLVEGPGFAPHLSGLDNLRAYWAAGDDPRDLAAAGLARALETAALGDAVHRPVAAYSHGMRQRLGIAQALLGDPELLVLDEPTDGLDPGQIRAMRGVLREAAARGATVLLSSHLLAEVEQTCSHVAVLRAGRLVTAGTVHDLVNADRTVVVTSPDVPRAADVVMRLIGEEDVAANGEGLVVRLGDTEVAAVVSALVAAGVPVTGVSPRHRLEEAFLGLMTGQRT